MLALGIAWGLKDACPPAPSQPRAFGAKPKRSREATAEFQRKEPCPATGKPSGPCPGYVKDHVVALCAGGRDSPSNMQWQTTEAAKEKDKTECKNGRVK